MRPPARHHGPVAFLTAKKVIPHIENINDGVGAIANVSSVHSHFTTEHKPAYITAKHAITEVTRAIATEGDGTLRGFSVLIGYALTPLMINQFNDTAEQRGISEQEVIGDVMLGQARRKEVMTPAKVANLFTFGFSRHGTHFNGSGTLRDGAYTNTYQ